MVPEETGKGTREQDSILPATASFDRAEVGEGTRDSEAYA